MTKLVAAVGYIRMSTDRQETSPEQQQQEVEAYAAKHGYNILRWYSDLGISGDKTDKRLEFQRMISDAEDGRFKAILCWDQDRFGRFDSLESGYWIHPLRQRGVQLVTCTDGIVDWSTFAGRMLYGMKQEGKHQYLVDLSNNVTRRMKQLAQQGLWVCGAVPVGYVIDSEKRLQLGSPEDVQFVRDLFEKYIGGMTTRALAKMAADRGFVSSKGKPWSVPGITALLKKPIYTGCMVYGKRQFSKYQPKSQPGSVRAQDEWIVIENNHPAIISQETFDQVQRLLKERRKHTCTHEATKKFPLSGLLRCSHCGHSMHGTTYNGEYFYVCGSYLNRPGECQRYVVKQDEILPQLLRVLRQKLFSPAMLKRVRQEMLQKLTQPKSDNDDYSNRIAALDRKIEAAEHRLLEISKDMIARVEGQIRQLEQQRRELQERQGQVPQKVMLTEEQISQRIEAAVEWFSKLEHMVGTKYNVPKLQHLLRQFIEKVDLSFDRQLWGKSKKRYRCELTGGTVHFRFIGVEHIGGALLPSLRDEAVEQLRVTLDFSGKQAA